MKNASKLILTLGLQLFTTKGAMSMENHPNLLELTGAKPVIDLNKSVLVLIDYQQEYLDGQLALPEIRNVLNESKKLLTLARSRNIPVVHVKQLGGTQGIFSGLHGDILQEVQPIPGEIIIEKNLPNAFAGTKLAEVLKTFGRRNQIIIAGLMTHMCVSSTASSAIEYGYFSTVIASTTTTRSLRGANDRLVDAEAVKTAALAALKDRFAIVIPNVEDLQGSHASAIKDK